MAGGSDAFSVAPRWDALWRSVGLRAARCFRADWGVPGNSLDGRRGFLAHAARGREDSGPGSADAVIRALASPARSVAHDNAERMAHPALQTRRLAVSSSSPVLSGGRVSKRSTPSQPRFSSTGSELTPRDPRAASGKEWPAIP